MVDIAEVQRVVRELLRTLHVPRQLAHVRVQEVELLVQPAVRVVPHRTVRRGECSLSQGPSSWLTNQYQPQRCA